MYRKRHARSNGQIETIVVGYRQLSIPGNGLFCFLSITRIFVLFLMSN